MSYSRLEINLLPPELRPSPAVQFSTVLIMTVILITAAVMALDVTLSLFRVTDLKRQKANLEQQLKDKANVTQEYAELTGTRDEIERYGRIIALTTLEYLDMPLVLDRVSRVLPDGVYIQEIGSERRRNRGDPVDLVLNLHISKTDPWLLQRTLAAFKDDPLFKNCYIKSARYGELQLDQYKQLFGINWSASGPDVSDSLLAPEYEVELHVRLEGPLPEVRPAVLDRSGWFKDFTLKKAPPPSEDNKEGEAAPAGQEAAGQGQAGRQPAGVTVKETH